ncbi:MAG: HD domain-containing protein, partial [Oscillospiraceae bacterium]|nr:HD domain-containing protein [Oscillospiraceae bacterium]
MDPSLVIPRRIEKWAKERPEIAALMASQYGDALIEAYESLDVSLLYQSVTHGVGHIERTMFFGAMIAMNERLSADETRDVLLCCSYHDIGRTDDRYDLDHGRKSAEMIGKGESLRSLFSEPEAAMAAIHAHSVPDDEAGDAPVIYNVKKLDKSTLYMACLKDADNIDRVRIYDLDESF